MSAKSDLAMKRDPDPGWLWIHVRILYLLTVITILGVSIATWTCLAEVQKLRREFHGQIVHRGVAEFDDTALKDTFTDRQLIQEEQQEEEEPKEDEDVRRVREEEQLLRVKRRAPRHEHGEEKKRPSFYYTPQRDMGREGSGMPEDWVWLTSYSRIPVSTPVVSSHKGTFISFTENKKLIPTPLPNMKIPLPPGRIICNTALHFFGGAHILFSDLNFVLIPIPNTLDVSVFSLLVFLAYYILY